MPKQTVEFVGKPSGDGECFAWEVDWETLKRISPAEAEFEREHWNEDGLHPLPIEQSTFLYYGDGSVMFDVNPDYSSEAERGKKYRVKIEIEEIA